MKAHRITLLAGVLALGTAGAAGASTINSPYLYAQGTDTLFCSAVNVTTVPLATLKIEMVDYTGAVTASTTCNNLLANANCGILSTPGAGARCRVTIAGSKTKVRALHEIDSAAGDTKFGMPIN